MPDDYKGLKVLPLPGNSLGDPNFYEEGPVPTPDNSNNGDIGFDNFAGGDPKPSFEGGGLPFKNLKGGR